MAEANNEAHIQTALTWFGFCETRARNWAAWFKHTGQHTHTLTEYEDLRHEATCAYMNFVRASGSNTNSALFMETHLRSIELAWKIQTLINDVHRNRNNA